MYDHNFVKQSKTTVIVSKGKKKKNPDTIIEHLPVNLSEILPSQVSQKCRQSHAEISLEVTCHTYITIL